MFRFFFGMSISAMVVLTAGCSMKQATTPPVTPTSTPQVTQATTPPATQASTPQAAQPQETPPASQYWAAAGPTEKNAYDTVRKIQEDSSKAKQLSQTQITTLKTYVNDPNNLVRLQVLSALGNATLGQTRDAAVVARQGLTSSDGMTRRYALTALDRMNAPDAVKLAQSMVSDHSQSVRDEAHRILKKYGLSN